jgi:Mrp family chromosome partitioning ATPase
LGLTAALAGEADLASVTVHDQATGLFVIPAGSASKNPADLLSSRAMQDLVAQLRQQNDYVVIDAPPILPVVDALAVAAIADRIVMVVEWGRTSRTSVAEALKTLRFAGYSVGGILLITSGWRATDTVLVETTLTGRGFAHWRNTDEIYTVYGVLQELPVPNGVMA